MEKSRHYEQKMVMWLGIDMAPMFGMVGDRHGIHARRSTLVLCDRLLMWHPRSVPRSSKALGQVKLLIE